MMLNILKVIEYDKTVAIEYVTRGGWPDTFTMTWDELLKNLTLEELAAPDGGLAQCVAIATGYLTLKVEEQETGTLRAQELLDLARKVVAEISKEQEVTHGS